MIFLQIKIFSNKHTKFKQLKKQVKTKFRKHKAIKPPHIRTLAAPVFPAVAAQSKGVIDFLFLSFTAAPDFSKHFIMSLCPLIAAKWRAELPSLSKSLIVDGCLSTMSSTTLKYFNKTR